MDMDIIRKLNDWSLFTYKSLFELFSRKTEISRTWKMNVSYLLSFKVYDLIKHISFQNMPVKIYAIFSYLQVRITSKLIFLKNKMRYGMWVHILMNNLASSPSHKEYQFWHRKSNAMLKAHSQVWQKFWQLKAI